MQSGFVQVPGGARLLGFGGLEVKSAECLGVPDCPGVWSFSFLISANRISFLVLSAMFVFPIFHCLHHGDDPRVFVSHSSEQSCLQEYLGSFCGNLGISGNEAAHSVVGLLVFAAIFVNVCAVR